MYKRPVECLNSLQELINREMKIKYIYINTVKNMLHTSEYVVGLMYRK